MKRLSAFLVLCIAFLAACQTPPPPIVSTKVPDVIAAVATNTARPAATATTRSAATPTSSTATPLPTVTSTSADTSTPAPTATPTVIAPTATLATRTLYVNAENGLNLRSEPSSTATLLRTLATGTQLTAIGTANPPDANGVAWQNVQTTDGQAGWVAAQFLIDAKPVAAAPTATPPTPPTANITPVVTPIAARGYVYVAA